MRKVDTSLIVRLCLPQFAVGLFTTMLNNYLIYFYQPSKTSGIPDLIPQGRLVLGVLTIIGMIKAVGHIIDAVTDPLIAAGSDKSRHKDGPVHPPDEKGGHPLRPVRPADLLRAAEPGERPQRRVDRRLHVGLLLRGAERAARRHDGGYHPVRHRHHRRQSGGHLRRGPELYREDGQLAGPL